MERLTKYSNDLIRNKAVNILRKLDSENGLDGDELALISSFCLIERMENKQLKKYEDLEEQGKLLKLPCAVGDTVHHLCTFKNGESEIIEMKVECVEPCGAIRQHKGVCEIWNVYAETDYTKAYFKFFDFDKTVFLIREEAEAALKEL